MSVLRSRISALGRTSSVTLRGTFGIEEILAATVVIRDDLHWSLSTTEFISEVLLDAGGTVMASLRRSVFILYNPLLTALHFLSSIDIVCLIIL